MKTKSHSLKVLNGNEVIFSTTLAEALSSPLSVYTPHDVRVGYEQAYRNVFGISGGSLCMSIGELDSESVALSRSVFQTTTKVKLSVFRTNAESKNVSCEDPSSVRELTFVMVSDYSAQNNK